MCLSKGNYTIRKKYIIVLSTHAPFLLSHRLLLLKELQAQRYDIFAILGKHPNNSVDHHALTKIEEEKIVVIRFMKAIVSFILLAIRERNHPHKVIFIGVRQMILGAPLMKIFSKSKHVLVFSGLGNLFNSKKLYHKNITFILCAYIKLFVKNSITIGIVQNHDDENFVKTKLGIKNVKLIKGSGVDLNLYPKNELNKKTNIVSFAGRILREKGVIEFIEAAKYINKQHPDWEFRIFGEIYKKNPSNLTLDQLNTLIENTNIKYYGHVDNINDYLIQSKVFCLPSYSEGLPKATIEACAAGCAIVTTDVPGCRDSIEHEVHGFIVPVKCVSSLIKSIKTLIISEDLRLNFSLNSRKLAEQEYCIKKITRKLIRFIGG